MFFSWLGRQEKPTYLLPALCSFKKCIRGLIRLLASPKDQSHREITNTNERKLYAKGTACAIVLPLFLLSQLIHRLGPGDHWQLEHLHIFDDMQKGYLHIYSLLYIFS